MKLEKADLLETVDMLNDSLGDGVIDVVYPEKKGFYVPSDFKLVREVERDFLGEEYFSGKGALDAWDFFDTLKRMSLRKDLGEVVDVAAVAGKMENEVLEVFRELKAIGLYEPFLEKEIRDRAKFGEHGEKPIFRELDGQKIGFLVNLEYTNGVAAFGLCGTGADTADGT